MFQPSPPPLGEDHPSAACGLQPPDAPGAGALKGLGEGLYVDVGG